MNSSDDSPASYSGDGEHTLIPIDNQELIQPQFGPHEEAKKIRRHRDQQTRSSIAQAYQSAQHVVEANGLPRGNRAHTIEMLMIIIQAKDSKIAASVKRTAYLERHIEALKCYILWNGQSGDLDLYQERYSNLADKISETNAGWMG